MPARSLAYGFMRFVTIKNDDFVLIHRDGVDYKTPFASVLASMPEANVEIEGVLTYKGVVDATTAEPQKNEGEIWLLLLADGDAANSWVPDGAKNGDYLTYASDTAGSTAWRLVGNAAGVDFEIYATKEDVQDAYDDLNSRLGSKAEADELRDLAGQVIGNTGKISGLTDKVAEQELAIGVLDSTVNAIHVKVDEVEAANNKLKVEVSGHEAQIQLMGKSIDVVHENIADNGEAIAELQAVKPFDFASLGLLPVA